MNFTFIYENCHALEIIFLRLILFFERQLYLKHSQILFHLISSTILPIITIEKKRLILTGNFDECVLNEVAIDIFTLPLLYKSFECWCCCIIVGDGEIPVDPGIIDASIILPPPFIVWWCDDSWWWFAAYIVAIKYSTIDSASSADNCTSCLVVSSLLEFNDSKLRWNAKMRKVFFLIR